jgi:hypothetical protein
MVSNILTFRQSDVKCRKVRNDSAHVTPAPVLSSVRRVAGQRGRLRTFGRPCVPLAFPRAADFGGSVLPVRNGRGRRPSPRSTYTSMSSGASPADLVSPRFGPLAGSSPRHRTRPRWHLWSHSPWNGRVESRSRVSPRLAAVLRQRSSRDPAPRGTSALSLARPPPNPPRLRHAKTLSSTSPHPFQGSRVF